MTETYHVTLFLNNCTPHLQYHPDKPFHLYFTLCLELVYPSLTLDLEGGMILVLLCSVHLHDTCDLVYLNVPIDKNIIGGLKQASSPSPPSTVAIKLYFLCMSTSTHLHSFPLGHTSPPPPPIAYTLITLHK